MSIKSIKCNLDLTEAKYNNNKLPVVEKKIRVTYKSQSFEWLRTFVINMMVKKKFRIQKNS